MSKTTSIKKPFFQELKTQKIIYCLYLAGIIFPIFVLIAGLILHLNKEKKRDKIEQSHTDLQLKSFWLSLLYLVIASVTVAFVIGIIVWVYYAVWSFIRNTKGIKYAVAHQEIPNTQTWHFDIDKG